MSDFVVEAFTNDVGQVIEPGDVVLYVGKSGDQIVTKQGNFDGVYYDNVRNWSTKQTERKITAVRVGNIPAQKWNWDREARKGWYTDRLRKAVLPMKRVYRLVQNG